MVIAQLEYQMFIVDGRALNNGKQEQVWWYVI